MRWRSSSRTQRHSKSLSPKSALVYSLEIRRQAEMLVRLPALELIHDVGDALWGAAFKAIVDDHEYGAAILASALRQAG